MNTYVAVMNDELLDIVDVNDNVIGQQYRAEVYAQKTSNFRVINAFLINSQKQVWIPRRSAHKKLFPLCLDTSVGGHVSAGETYDQAFARETQEEINVDISQMCYKFLAKLTPQQYPVSAFMHVYAIFTDQAPAYNTDDFIGADWYSIADLQALLKAGEPAKGDLPTLINLLHELAL
jgi:NTP pyrophosphohydrolases containing a Zn-finger, probably nucleic-acid-binding